MTHGSCTHCALPIPPSGEVRSDAHPQAKFCCIGCRAAYSFIYSAGLARFYDHRETPADATPVTAHADYSEFGEASVAEPFLSNGKGGRRQVQVYVGNLHCAACIWLLEEVLRQLDGVRVLAANAASHRISIEFDPDKTGLDKVLATIAAPGFDPEPVVPGTTAESEQRDYRAAIKRLVVAGVFGMQTMMFAIGLYAGEFQGIAERYAGLLRYASLLTILPILTYSAVPFFGGAWRSLRYRRVSMDVLVSAALLTAFGASVLTTLRGDGAVYFDSIAMFVLFLSTSRFLEMRARHRADASFEAAAASLPASGLKVLADGDCQRQAPADFRTEDLLRVGAGEILAADGIIRAGQGHFDEAMLSGEAEPRRRELGAQVYAGTRMLSGDCDIEVTASGANTRLAELSQLVDAAAGDRASWRSLTESIAARFVLAVLAVAFATGLYWWQAEPERAVAIVLSVLIVACPCALSIAAPSALAFAATALRNRGILLVRSRLLDTLRPGNVFVFDKTGTLTLGEPEIVDIEVLTSAATREELTAIAASLESGNPHPIARAFEKVAAAPVRLDSEATALPGLGIRGTYKGIEYCLGSAAWTNAVDQACSAERSGQTEVYLRAEGSVLARFRLQDKLRPGASALVRELLSGGDEVVIASGDSENAVAAVANSLGIATWFAEQTPEQKQHSIAALQERGKRVVMIGDGVNDAPVMASADCSIAVGNASHLAKASADALLVTEHLSAIRVLMETARRSRTVITQSVAWAISYNLTAVTLAALGFVAPWLAAIGMSASSLLVVLNATRLRETSASSDAPATPSGGSNDDLVPANSA